MWIILSINENCAININYVNEMKINSRIERDFEIENKDFDEFCYVKKLEDDKSSVNYDRKTKMR